VISYSPETFKSTPDEIVKTIAFRHHARDNRSRFTPTLYISFPAQDQELTSEANFLSTLKVYMEEERAALT
jgi:hypothetical protein